MLDNAGEIKERLLMAYEYIDKPEQSGGVVTKKRGRLPESGGQSSRPV